MTVLRAIARLCAAALLTGLVSACATTGIAGDPLEPLNRAIFGFNETFDEALMKPVAQGYRAALPEMVRNGVSNFYSNIEDVWIAANNLLQGKPESALQDVMRVAINTVIGLGGLIDVASDAGLEKHNEDFGQTLGRWGIGSGPYLVLPFLGASNLRDGIGLLGVDYAVDPVWNVDHMPTRNTLYSVRAVNSRANSLDAVRVLEEAALDKYRFVRESYLQRRRSLIYDGDPPREREDPSAALSAPLGAPAQAAAEEHGNETVVPRLRLSGQIAYPVSGGAAPSASYSLR
jgi:phospholipid-binding lipoprotein MlaA